jgi:hypothetical protein
MEHRIGGVDIKSTLWFPCGALARIVDSRRKQ